MYWDFYFLLSSTIHYWQYGSSMITCVSVFCYIHSLRVCYDKEEFPQIIAFWIIKSKDLDSFRIKIKNINLIFIISSAKTINYAII